MSHRILGFLLILLFNFQLFASENSCKIKVDPAKISFQCDGMYYSYNGLEIELSSLEFENGRYVARAPTGIIEDIFGTWWCYNCQNWNSKHDTSCFYCGKPR